MRYYTLGRKYADRGKISLAEFWFDRGIRHGDIKCAYGAFALKMTVGTEPQTEWQSFIDVLPDIKMLAEKGDGEACFIVAKCYESGCGGEQDIKKAIIWYKKAAARGCLDAAYNLGGTFCFDKDFLDLEKGIKYLKFAAQANRKDAQRCLSRVYELQGNKKAAAFWQKRADRGRRSTEKQ